MAPVTEWFTRWFGQGGAAHRAKQAQEQLFAVGPGGEWPTGTAILPGGLGRLRGTYGDGAMRQRIGPRVDARGQLRYFAGEDE